LKSLPFKNIIMTKRPRKISEIQNIQAANESFVWESQESISDRQSVDSLLDSVQLKEHYFLTKETMLSLLGMKKTLIGPYYRQVGEHKDIVGIELALSVENGELKFYFRSINADGEGVGSHTPIGREP
jgi:hypothetical protein